VLTLNKSENVVANPRKCRYNICSRRIWGRRRRMFNMGGVEFGRPAVTCRIASSIYELRTRSVLVADCYPLADCSISLIAYAAAIAKRRRMLLRALLS